MIAPSYSGDGLFHVGTIRVGATMAPFKSLLSSIKLMYITENRNISIHLNKLEYIWWAEVLYIKFIYLWRSKYIHLCWKCKINLNKRGQFLSVRATWLGISNEAGHWQRGWTLATKLGIQKFENSHLTIGKNAVSHHFMCCSWITCWTCISHCLIAIGNGWQKCA